MSERQRSEDLDNHQEEGITASFLSLRSGLHKFLMRFLIRRQDVEDIVQETFIRAYESEQKQKIHSPKSFLYTIAKNIALSKLDSKGARITSYVGDLEDLNIAADHCVEDDVATQQRLTAVLQVVVTLPPQCQRVVVMKKIFGFSHQEIGERLQISVRTVEKHLAKALQRCQESLPVEPPARQPVANRRTARVKVLAMRGRGE